MYGRNPYGLISKYQGFKVKGRKLSEVGRIVFAALIRNQLTAFRLVSCLVEQFMYADDPIAASRHIELLEHANSIPADLLGRIKEKTISTATIYESEEVRRRINTLLQKHGCENAERPATSYEMNEDEIPF